MKKQLEKLSEQMKKATKSFRVGHIDRYCIEEQLRVNEAVLETFTELVKRVEALEKKVLT